MRHGNKKAKLGRPADQRKALLRSLTTELLRHGKIKTTKVTTYRHNIHGAVALQGMLTTILLHPADFAFCVVQVKAKAMRKPVDKMITLAKDGTLHARRQARQYA